MSFLSLDKSFRNCQYSYVALKDLLFKGLFFFSFLESIPVDLASTEVDWMNLHLVLKPADR